MTIQRHHEWLTFDYNIVIEIEQQEARRSCVDSASAKDWMKHWHSTMGGENGIWAKSAPGLSSSLPPEHQEPVRIAIIDTGAAIDEALLESYDYNGRSRFCACRSWADEQYGDQGKEIGHEDFVGHGTHATSLALKITENTDCEIYVAQVFQGDPQKIMEEEQTSKSTATSAIAKVSLKALI
jgi:hypothetical protein